MFRDYIAETTSNSQFSRYYLFLNVACVKVGNSNFYSNKKENIPILKFNNFEIIKKLNIDDSMFYSIYDTVW